MSDLVVKISADISKLDAGIRAASRTIETLSKDIATNITAPAVKTVTVQADTSAATKAVQAVDVATRDITKPKRINLDATSFTRSLDGVSGKLTNLAGKKIRIDADTKPLEQAIDAAASKASTFKEILTGSFLGGLTANLATDVWHAFTGAISDTVHALQEVDKISGQTAAVIKSTGGAAGVTADQVSALADSLERKTGVEAESIQRGQNLLLTFTNIKDAAGAGNDIFTQTTKIMTDLGTAMGTDASGAAIQLGKALNDPTQGITALTRVGVSFTDAQKAQIKALQESGQMMAAQRIILAELNKEFGGSADAAGKTFAGAMQRAKNALGSIFEAMATPAVPMFTAALIKVSDAAYAVSDAITKGNIGGLLTSAFGPGTLSLITGITVALGVQMAGSIRTVTAQAATMAAGYLRAAAAMAAANAPVLAAIAAISFAAYPFIKNWDAVKEIFGAVWRTMRDAVMTSMKAIGDISASAWRTISGHFSAAYHNFVSAFIAPVGRAFSALFDALPQGVRDAIGSFKMPAINWEIPGVSAAFASVKSVAMDAYDTVRGGAMIAAEQFGQTWADLPGMVSGAMKGFTAAVTSAASASAASFAPVGAAVDVVGKTADTAHKKAGKAANEHAKKVEELQSPYISLGKLLFGTMARANELTATIAKAKMDRWNEMIKPLTDAQKKLSDLDQQAKFWNDTTDKTSERMGILRQAINDAMARGVDPASPALATMRAEYDKLAASQSPVIEKTASIGEKMGALSTAMGIVGSAAIALSGGDSPLAQMVGTFQESISVFQSVQRATDEIGRTFFAAQDASGNLVSGLGSLGAEIGIVAAALFGLYKLFDPFIESIGGWGQVFDGLVISFQAMGWAFATIGERVIGPVINAIGKAWTALVNGFKVQANIVIAALNGIISAQRALGLGGEYIDQIKYDVYEEVNVNFTSGLEQAMAETAARMGKRFGEAAPGFKEAEAAYKAVKNAETKAKILGDGGNLNSEKINILTRAISSMIDKGVDPASQHFATLKSELDKLKSTTAQTTRAITTQVESPMRTLNAQQEEFLRGYNGLIQKALDKGNESEARRLTTEAATKRAEMLAEINKVGTIPAAPPIAPTSKYRVQSLASDIREPMVGTTPTVVVNYTGNGKWTREDAQALGGLIVGELKAAGVRT